MTKHFSTLDTKTKTHTQPKRKKKPKKQKAQKTRENICWKWVTAQLGTVS
jgi:hypothetical protein